jgi:hypothetical protein
MIIMLASWLVKKNISIKGVVTETNVAADIPEGNFEGNHCCCGIAK